MYVVPQLKQQQKKPGWFSAYSAAHRASYHSEAPCSTGLEAGVRVLEAEGLALRPPSYTFNLGFPGWPLLRTVAGELTLSFPPPVQLTYRAFEISSHFTGERWTQQRRRALPNATQQVRVGLAENAGLPAHVEFQINSVLV